MSDLPVSWERSTVGEIFLEIKNGSSALQNKANIGIPITRIETIQNSHFDLNRVQHIEAPSSEFVEKYKYEIGDIAFSHINSYEHVGKTAIYLGVPEILLHGMNLLRLRLGHSFVDPEFARYFMLSKEFRDEVRERVGHAVNQVSINQKNLSQVPFRVPPLIEQKRIVEKLEKLLGKVEAAQERLDKIPAILKRFRQSTLAAACSGKLTADWRDKNRNIEGKSERLEQLRANRLKLAKTNKAKETLEPKFVDGENADYPVTWLLLNAECVCDFITKGTTPNTKLITTKGDIPFLKVFHIVENKIDFHSIPCFVPQESHDNLLSRSKVFPRDVLMNIVGPPLNKVAIVPNDFPEWNINQALAIFRPIEGLLPEFIRLILSHEGTIEHVIRETRGIVGQSNISLEQCRNIEIPIPVLDEQKEIVRRVEELFKFADQIEERYKKARSYTDKLTQSILAKAFRGELVPQDDRDEPAAKLLERIKQNSPPEKPKRGMKKNS